LQGVPGARRGRPEIPMTGTQADTVSLARGDSLLKSFWFRSPGGPSITLQQWWVWVRFCV
jgi:hypothetical protein